MHFDASIDKRIRSEPCSGGKLCCRWLYRTRGIEQLKIAATIYANVTSPVQHAAVKAYTASSGIDEYFTKHASRMLKGAEALENFLNS